jgi:hypothetical protein
MALPITTTAILMDLEQYYHAPNAQSPTALSDLRDEAQQPGR